MRKNRNHYPERKPTSYQTDITSAKGKLRRLLIYRETIIEQLAELDEKIQKEDVTFALRAQIEKELNGE